MLLLDLNLPGIPGLVIARKYREKWKDLVILVSSGYVNAKDQEKLKALGVAKILTKPFSLDHLYQNLRETLSLGLGKI